ncbi:MAG TPA: hypothetical protein VEA80_05915 [Vitreimonas sp.]|nr:hypothetical protein [Vitreimonas sp.]HYD86988.1 hypothetical protein [Vitreimonas sp.]
MFESWQEVVRLLAAGGLGGLGYWAISHREAILTLLRSAKGVS